MSNQYTRYSPLGGSTGSGGASSWKAPVANFAALPLVGNTSGDARVTQDTSDIYIWSGSAWVLDSAADANAIYRDGSQPPTADQPWNSRAITGFSHLDSNAASPAASGAIRLGNTQAVAFRNAGDSADKSISLNVSDIFTIGAPISVNGQATITGASDTPQLFVRGNPTQTSNLIEAYDSALVLQLSLSNTGDLTANGNILGSRIRGSAGTAGLPTFSSSGDTDTGDYAAASDTWSTSAGGVRMQDVSQSGVTTYANGNLTYGLNIIPNAGAFVRMQMFGGAKGFWVQALDQTDASLTLATQGTGQYLQFQLNSDASVSINQLNPGNITPNSNNGADFGGLNLAWKSIYAGTSMVAPLHQGGAASGGSIEISSTSHATKGYATIKDGTTLSVDPGGFNSSLSAFATALGGRYAEIISENTSYSMAFTNANASALGNEIDAFRSRGSYASPVQLNNNDVIVTYNGIPWDGTGTFSSGMANFRGFTAMVMAAAEAHTTSNMGTKINFQITQNGTNSTTLTPLTINSNGLLLPNSGTANKILWSTDNVGYIGSGSGDPKGIFVGTDGVVSRGVFNTSLSTDSSSTSTGSIIASGGLGVAKNANIGAQLKATVLVPTVVALVDGATPALDAATGNHFTLTAAGNRTIAVPSNPVDGQKIVIAHTASGADRTLSLNTGAGGFIFGTDITTLTATTNGKTDFIGCIYSSGLTKWAVVSYIKGF